MRFPVVLLFTPFTVTRFAMHRIYADRINSRDMSRVFCDLRSQKTPRGILPVNSNVWIAIFMQLFLAALDKMIFRDYNYNSVIYHCYIGGVQN